MDLSSIPSGWLIALWFGLVGLCVGSFANVVVYRLPIMRKLGEYADGQRLQELAAKHGKFNLSLPSSRCPCCDTRIKIQHNIPVLSWLFLRGKCVSCASPIPKKYPAVELLFGLAFAGFVWFEGLWIAGLLTLPLMFLGFCMLTIFFQTKQVVKPFVFSYFGVLILQMILTSMGYSSFAP